MSEREPESGGGNEGLPNVPVTLLLGAAGVGAQFSAACEYGHSGLFTPAAVMILLAGGGEVVRRLYRRYKYDHRDEIPKDDWPKDWWKEIE